MRLENKVVMVSGAASGIGRATAVLFAREGARLVLNDRLDAAVTGVLIVLVGVILIESILEWTRVLSGKKEARVKESPFVATRFAIEEQG